MLLVDARRLTGPNHMARAPLVLVEISLEPAEALEIVLSAYLGELWRVRHALGLPTSVTPVVRPHQGGAVIGYEAPIDEMLACTEMSEWAALSATELLAGREPFALEPRLAEIETILARDRNPRLLALAAEARRRDLPFLWDDLEVSVGTGHLCASFSIASIPAVADVPWDTLGAIPVALITGTNGKTTSSRLLARVATEAGFRVGTSSTSGISIGSEIIEEGDWTGPAAARRILRRKDVELAVLETARGGILRRGLAIEACDAALITNVSDDHVGGYGIDDLDAMTAVKGVVAEAVRETGAAVLNARDPNLVRLAQRLSSRVIFFADLDAGDPATRSVVTRHRAGGHEAVVARGGEVVWARGDEEVVLLRVDAAPITFDGFARYNVENILGVIAAARALGIKDDAIVRGVRGFGTADNPGRGELVDLGGVRVLLDFGHNPDGVRAVLALVAALRAGHGHGEGRLTVVTGCAGDRREREIEEIARTVLEALPDRVIVRDLPDYLRGRALGEVPALFERAFRELGLPEGAFSIVPTEVDALRSALHDARPGDFIAVLVHLDHAEVHAFLEERA